MSTLIEDYAFVSNCRTGALISRDGSIDWLCVPRLDSASVFGALLGKSENGRWRIRPVDDRAESTRRYLDDTMVLITRWETADGVAEVHDFMPIGGEGHHDPGRVDLVRRIVGISGEVRFRQSLRMRFDYSRATPWVRQTGTPEHPELLAMAGPDALVIRGAELRATDRVHRGTVTVAAGRAVDMTLTWFRSHRSAPAALDVDRTMEATRQWWQSWADRIHHDGKHRDQVVRSLVLLRALTNHQTGGIAAAATTSLPEEFGGARNWDYRYVWLRDVALTLETMIDHGFLSVVDHWREWLLRAVAGDPADLQIMYGLAGERDLAEREMQSLPGYENSAPVRVGNGAVGQFQADVVGEVMVTLCAAREAGLAESKYSWALQRALVRYVTDKFEKPDQGIWEIRGRAQMFTQSRAMVWATFDRAVRAVEVHGLSGPVDEWRRLRDRAKAEIDEKGVTDGHFTQHYNTTEVDASLLLLPQIGFCDPDDPRMLATVAKIEQDLMQQGLLRRYRTTTGEDGLPGSEYSFLACSFWLVEQYASTGRAADAESLMNTLCALTNDVGMLSEEYDVDGARHAGNTPQALSHLTLVRAADALSRSAPKCR
ncbi:glycoside hydrolase family 15 protein [Dietzia alimentaria]|uniref:glycoside hydrolase family 15 protein n=1 Tax=Dietzia alimentaria TaxID=665550 RepID=UPI000497288A|nr:glycoside hydrolase family 15 protein [Dietzia alimentaria]